MKLFIIAFCLILSGCATPSAKLISTTFQPTKGGIVKYESLSESGSRANANAAVQVMQSFCAPDNIAIIKQDRRSEISGYSIDRDYSGQTTGFSNQGKIYIFTEFQCKENKMSSLMNDISREADRPR